MLSDVTEVTWTETCSVTPVIHILSCGLLIRELGNSSISTSSNHDLVIIFLSFIGYLQYFFISHGYFSNLV
jgi:hypothetical protein